MKVTRFNEALAERGDARRAVMHCLSFPFAFAVSKGEACDIQAQWVLDNAAAIAAHQSGLDCSNDSMINTLGREVDELAERVQQLEDAPGPRANQEEVSALRQRMDSLTETLGKMQGLDTSDVLERLVRDVALLKDERIVGYTHEVTYDSCKKFSNAVFGTEPQTDEARKLLCLGVATPEPEPVYEWNGTDYCVGDTPVGQVGIIYTDEWIGFCDNYPYHSPRLKTKAEARAWVEAMFKTLKP